MKKLIQRWPKPLARFTFKTCYSSTVQVIPPRGVGSTWLCTLHNSHTYHEHFPPPAVMPTCPRGHGIVQTQLDKHKKRKCLSLWQSHGSFWCGAGGEQQKLLFIIPYQCSRGTEGGREDAVLPGAELCVPGSHWLYPTSATLTLSPGSQGLAPDGHVATPLLGHRQSKHSSPLPVRALLCSSPSSFISSL